MKPFIDEQIWQLENLEWISKCLSLWPAPVIIVPKIPDSLNSQKNPLNSQKKQLHLVLGYWLINKSTNTAYNGKSVISCYLLLNIRQLLARLQKCTIFSSLDLRSGYYCINLTLEASQKQLFPQQVINGNGMNLTFVYTCHQMCFTI